MSNQKSNHNKAGLGALFLSAVLLAVLSPVTGFAQIECQVPPFVQQGLTGANVMILADNSGSMNSASYSSAYESTIEWPGDFSNDATYFAKKRGNYSPDDFNLDFTPSSTPAPMVASDNGEDGRYSGNYLNWIFYHATEEQRAAIPQVTRIQVLKNVLSQVVGSASGLRMGLTVFQNDHGGSIIGNCGSNPKSLQAQIAGITANAWTPLGEACETILDYFSGDLPSSPILSPCQYNFNIIVTDGLPTMDREVSGYLHDADGDGNDPGNCASIGSPSPEWNNCTDHVDDVVWWMAHKDLRADMPDTQRVMTYVVGYHEAAPLLQETADNGDGLFFHAENAADLIQSIRFAILDIMRRISAGSAVAVVSTERGTDDRLYRAKFMPVDWTGMLESYALPYNDGDTPIWDAGEILSTSNSPRNIFTGLGDTRYDFRSSSAASLKDDMQVDTEQEAADLINWARGEPVAGLRERFGWILGDIVNSTPVVVGAPREFIMEESYQNFQAAQENRRKMVYVGANDGMVHAFDALNGGEVWAFVPQFALPHFATMADSFYCHIYSCDQTMSIKDVKLGNTWRTVMFGGGGGGGAGIFAMDITNPNAPSLMWQAALPDNKTWHSEIEIGSIGGRPVAIVGSGLDDQDGEAYVYVYDVATGNYHGDELLSSESKELNMATRPALVDRDLDGETDLVYIADRLGSLWRFEIGSDPDPGSWEKTQLYSGDDIITADPVASYGPGGDIYVYFGTGSYMFEDDMVSEDQNYFLCVIDNHSGARLDKGDLENQTSTISDVSGSSGWYLALWNELGERVTQRAIVVAETVIFTSFAPTLNVCVGGGSSFLYQMRYDDGGVPEVDGMEDPGDRAIELGEGIAAYPVVDLTEGTVIVQSSDATITVTPIASTYQRLTVRSWQESFDHVDQVTTPAGDSNYQ